MNWIDYLIGAALMNAMPHFVLGVWSGRMLSLFGFGDRANKAYGWLCFIVAVGLFCWRHGAEKLLENSIFAGAATILVIYFLTGRFWQKLFSKKSDA